MPRNITAPLLRCLSAGIGSWNIDPGFVHHRAVAEDHASVTDPSSHALAGCRLELRVIELQGAVFRCAYDRGG